MPKLSTLISENRKSYKQIALKSKVTILRQLVFVSSSFRRGDGSHFSELNIFEISTTKRGKKNLILI